MGRDYYAILGVPKGTSDENELKKGEITVVFDPNISQMAIISPMDRSGARIGS